MANKELPVLPKILLLGWVDGVPKADEVFVPKPELPVAEPKKLLGVLEDVDVPKFVFEPEVEPKLKEVPVFGVPNPVVEPIPVLAAGVVAVSAETGGNNISMKRFNELFSENNKTKKFLTVRF